jgi:hypothetical protein
MVNNMVNNMVNSSNNMVNSSAKDLPLRDLRSHSPQAWQAK